MTEQRFTEILDAFLGEPELSMAVNQAKTFEEGYELVARKVEGLSLEEFREAMDMVRQVMLAAAGGGNVVG